MRMPSLKAVQSFLKSTTARLAMSYLVIIMLMSIGFSVVFYSVSARELGPHGPHPVLDQSQSNSQTDLDMRPRIERDPAVKAYLKQREAQGKRELLERLIYLNIIALAAGSALSYYLARRTLRPIEENMDAQAQFVSDASHELRTPLTALQTTNEVALRKPKITENEARNLLAKNVAEVTKLQALTTALLKLARSDGSDTRHVPVSLQNAASEAMNKFISAAQNKDIVIEDTVPDISVNGDTTSLAQTIAILLDNAIKYSPENSTILLSGSKNGKTGSISIQDHGQGIASKDLPHIFDRFYRADQSRTQNTSGEVDGYGIGLSLAKKLVHQMNGEIIVTSAEGKGSTFTIRMPLAS